MANSLRSPEQIHVPLAFVDSRVASKPGSRGQCGDNDLKQGHRVVVKNGKHGGKEGILAVIRRNVVTVVEDVSGVQVLKYFIFILRSQLKGDYRLSRGDRISESFLQSKNLKTQVNHRRKLDNEISLSPSLFPSE